MPKILYGSLFPIFTDISDLFYAVCKTRKKIQKPSSSEETVQAKVKRAKDGSDMTGLGAFATVQAREFWICWRRDN